MPDTSFLNRDVPGWTPRPRPDRIVHTGRHVRLEPLVQAHAESLHAAFSEDQTGHLWDWMPYGPFASAEAYRAWIASVETAADPVFFSVFDLDADPARPVGVMSLMRIDPAFGVIEVGGIAFSPRLQRRPATTEAEYLLMRHCIEDLGYRRYEWKCNTLNLPSRAAALRLGFQFEGVFRNHMILKGRNRDTAWFGLTAEDWPGLKAGFEAWLDPANFDGAGRQIRRLEACRAAP